MPQPAPGRPARLCNFNQRVDGPDSLAAHEAVNTLPLLNEHHLTNMYKYPPKVLSYLTLIINYTYTNT